ncbi:PREDICTED: histone-lysine N-methyltransferase SETMAR-like [Atta cephalotes]|uniref:Mos1 transposase HTH domain-containing protein n=1 Tax=Atta cephalotes TaxID=12957 RepID=A0A158NN62_ATTCE|nr:PREDICTED: histone-lysine N-methyltransferase SETMAR-like [Atta cephalotes]
MQKQTCRKICEVYGADAVSERRTQEWFFRFRSGNFEVKDRSRSGRPVTEKVDEILQLVEQDRHKLDVWVPHELTQRNLIDRISISETLLKRNESDPFLKQIITGDEKWVKYKNIVRKRSWGKRGEPPQTTSKPGLMANKEAIKEKRPELITEKVLSSIMIMPDHVFDDAPKIEGAWLRSFDPSYSPDLAPSDYHLFRCRIYLLMEKHWPTKELPKIT